MRQRRGWLRRGGEGHARPGGHEPYCEWRGPDGVPWDRWRAFARAGDAFNRPDGSTPLWQVPETSRRCRGDRPGTQVEQTPRCLIHSLVGPAWRLGTPCVYAGLAAACWHVTCVQPWPSQARPGPVASSRPLRLQTQPHLRAVTVTLSTQYFSILPRLLGATCRWCGPSLLESESARRAAAVIYSYLNARDDV